MKRIITAGSIAALAVVGFAGTASAVQPESPGCFGQTHKAVNETIGVGTAMQTLFAETKGQGKKAFASC